MVEDSELLDAPKEIENKVRGTVKQQNSTCETWTNISGTRNRVHWLRSGKQWRQNSIGPFYVNFEWISIGQVRERVQLPPQLRSIEIFESNRMYR